MSEFNKEEEADRLLHLDVIIRENKRIQAEIEAREAAQFTAKIKNMDIYSINNRHDFMALGEAERIEYIEKSLGDWESAGYNTIHQVRLNPNKVLRETYPYVSRQTYAGASHRNRWFRRSITGCGSFIAGLIRDGFRLTKTLEEIKKEEAEKRAKLAALRPKVQGESKRRSKAAQLGAMTRRAKDFSLDSWLVDTVIDGDIEESEDNRIPEELMSFSAVSWAND